MSFFMLRESDSGSKLFMLDTNTMVAEWASKSDVVAYFRRNGMTLMRLRDAVEISYRNGDVTIGCDAFSICLQHLTKSVIISIQGKRYNFTVRDSKVVDLGPGEALAAAIRAAEAEVIGIELIAAYIFKRKAYVLVRFLYRGEFMPIMFTFDAGTGVLDSCESMRNIIVCDKFLM